jgi:prepilin-type N-terminal cleavage/methylation domain-containing protein
MRRCAGFTLLELLVVIGVISVLTGLSLGYLGKTDPDRLVAAILAGELRAAQLTARAEGVATEVLVRPGAEGEPATVQARLLQPLVTFGFEPGTPVLDESLRAAIGGEEVKAGRFGRARRPLAGERNAVLSWPLPPAVARLGDGFVVRLDLYLERRAMATVLQLPPMLELQLDGDLRPRARLRLHGSGGSSTTAAVTSELALPVGRWCTLDVGCDGLSLWLTLDGRELGRAVAEGVPQQSDDGLFQVSPADSPLPGAVDEVRWFQFAWSTAQKLPPARQPVKSYRFGFDARGEPTTSPVIQYVEEERP